MSVSFPSADFAPTLGGYTGQGPFRFWCQKVLPIVYDDSLSYYELLNKVVIYLNNVISDVSSVIDNVDLLRKAYDELQSYVNNYFDSLDVQDEINNKLDEMASDGTLSTLIVQQIVNSIGFVTPEMFGGVGDGVTDDTAALQKCADSGKPILFDGDKIYIIRNTILFNYPSTVIGNNSTVKWGGSERPENNCMFGYLANAVIYNLTLDGNNSINFGGRTYLWVRLDYVTLYYCNFVNFTNRKTTDAFPEGSDPAMEGVSGFYASNCQTFGCYWCKVDNCFNSWEGTSAGSTGVQGLSAGNSKTVEVLWCDISNILNEKLYPGYDQQARDFHDADGINMHGGEYVQNIDCICVVEYNTFTNCSGRFVKSQMPCIIKYNKCVLDNILLLANFRGFDSQIGDCDIKYNEITFGNILKYTREIAREVDGVTQIISAEIQSGGSAAISASANRSIRQTKSCDVRFNHCELGEFQPAYFLILGQNYSVSDGVQIPFIAGIRNEIKVKDNYSPCGTFIYYSFPYAYTALYVERNFSYSVKENFVRPNLNAEGYGDRLADLKILHNYRTSGVAIFNDSMGDSVCVNITYDTPPASIPDGFTQAATFIRENTGWFLRGYLFAYGVTTFRGTTVHYFGQKPTNRDNITLTFFYGAMVYQGTVTFTNDVANITSYNIYTGTTTQVT